VSLSIIYQNLKHLETFLENEKVVIKLNEDVDKSPSFYSIGSRSLNI
jgi:hypothetical protein